MSRQMTREIREYLEREAQGEENAKAPRAVARGIYGNEVSVVAVRQVSSRLSMMFRSGSVQRKPGRTPKRYQYFIARYEEPVRNEIVQEEPTSDLFGMLLDAVAKRVVEQMTPILRQEIAAYVQTLPEPLRKPQKVKLPKILVVGPLPGQGRVLKREFKGLADIIVVHSDDKAQLAGAAAKEAETTILWTNYIGHDVEDSVKKVGVKPLRVRGGLTELKRKIVESLGV